MINPYPVVTCHVSDTGRVSVISRVSNTRRAPDIGRGVGVCCTDRSRVPGISRVSHTGRGSKSFVLIEAGGFYPGFYGRRNKKVTKHWNKV
jgi:hypothetical protein